MNSHEVCKYRSVEFALWLSLFFLNLAKSVPFLKKQVF